MRAIAGQRTADWVTRRQGVVGGKAVLTGTRIPVFMVYDLYDGGNLTPIREAYPHLSDAQILGALLWAREHEGEVEADRRTYREQFEGTPLEM